MIKIAIITIRVPSEGTPFINIDYQDVISDGIHYNFVNKSYGAYYISDENKCSRTGDGGGSLFTTDINNVEEHKSKLIQAHVNYWKNQALNAIYIMNGVDPGYSLNKI